MVRKFQLYSYPLWLQLAPLLIGAVFINAIMLLFQPVASSIFLYVSVNIVLLASGAIMLCLSINIRNHHLTDIDSLRSAIALLEEKLELDTSINETPLVALARVTKQVKHLLKRDQEVRHLVRVQGLIDHELAVGNRVFFESKLQHYLNDLTEVGYGAVYIIQLSHPEVSRAGIKQVSRLKGCVDVLNGIAGGYASTVIARLSETDLVMLIAGLGGKEMEKLGDRMALLLSRASCFADCSGQDVLHIGYAEYQREQTSYQILSEADMALKTAQLHGPNSAFGFIMQCDKPQAKGSAWWRSELNKALQEHRFSLTFQPVFSWHDGDIIQQEVLVRLQSSDNKQIPAAIFLPMAHNCGLSSQIDQHVLIKTAKLCAADMGNYSRCSVNISIQSLLEPQWWQWLDHMVVSGQLEPHTLALEIPEHHLLKHYTQLRKSLNTLHALGFALIIDQVGLVIDKAVYLDELPLESVKLHPSVVRNIDQHLEQQLFVRGLIASYAGKSIRVLATGVELETEWQALQKLGIAGGQGFYFSQPVNQIITQSQH